MKINYELLNNKIGIYLIINTLNGKKYVGSSRNLYDRLHGHVHHLKNGTHHNKHLQSAYNKYGSKNFDYTILEYCEESKVFIREQYYIDCLKPEYNKSLNVKGNLNTVVSKETRNKISKTLKEKYKNGLKSEGFASLRKEVYQFSLTGELLNRYESGVQASYALNIAETSISKCCVNKNKYNTAGGFVFSFTTTFPKSCAINNRLVPIKILNTDNNSILSFSSIRECSETLNIPLSCLNRLIKDKNRIYKNTYKIYDERNNTTEST